VSFPQDTSTFVYALAGRFVCIWITFDCVRHCSREICIQPLNHWANWTTQATHPQVAKWMDKRTHIALDDFIRSALSLFHPFTRGGRGCCGWWWIVGGKARCCILSRGCCCTLLFMRPSISFYWRQLYLVSAPVTRVVLEAAL